MAAILAMGFGRAMSELIRLSYLCVYMYFVRIYICIHTYTRVYAYVYIHICVVCARAYTQAELYLHKTSIYTLIDLHE